MKIRLRNWGQEWGRNGAGMGQNWGRTNLRTPFLACPKQFGVTIDKA